ncbi:3-keto-disaccharide hydrolase [Croceitalea rosinachiae]|uniref:DUF1080 domain-containing protein n=1 Tax=Croceitalea rosinachiae TaxID=3075596 RepID=A0ABU3ACE4_9FLAO|nr:DUF1080 domain-containing protein [Croceitalea sp. F388]MDT0607578.1 DUF1080 domain-containing protein [Croceitalea sp. F388]
MRLFEQYILFALIIATLQGCSMAKEQQLFNGKNLDGWYVDVPAMDSITSAINPFVVRNGNLVSLGEPQGHLITNDSFKNYRLTLQYRFVSEPGNCGVLVHASTPRALYKMFPKSIEVQLMYENAGDFWCIVEDITTDNMEERRGPKSDWGITEGKLRRIKNLTDDSEKPLGEWNSLVVECINTTVKVWINDNLVNYGYNSTATSGQIAIQAEGSEVEFAEIKLQQIGSK